MKHAAIECLSAFQHSLSSHHSKHLLVIGTGIAGLYLVGQVYVSYKRAQRRKKWASVEKNMVILHQFGRGKNTPSISPFPLKLETYLRMTGIPYESDFEEPMGSKGKCPWITLNGDEISDSQLCMELLARKFHKDCSAHLSTEEQAIARAFQIMAEEHLYWGLLLWRWIYTRGRTLCLLMPLAIKKLKGQAYGQGMGRHTEAEVIEMSIKDLRAISNFLGTKPFLMGDKAIEADCAVFGILSQLLWNCPGSPFEQLVNGEFSNLKSYCERMKETFWPDWDRCLNPPRI
ncbi:GST-N-Metaxin-like protein [Daphnia sinensis]|uniref:GST-N-Metaxin-like protein n=1 Tax=Daphnia sinensis TaxID=1820382 RepID=A0AAD5KQ12_9CRUS|nr:GST-N-Metaxin-like protein [Daphnia sinensis]